MPTDRRTTPSGFSPRPTPSPGLLARAALGALGLAPLASAAPAAGEALAAARAAPSPTAPPPARAGEEELSLEELLARFRERRDALLVELGARVESGVQRLAQALAQKDRSAREAAREGLVALGAPAAPLLVGRLDPGRGAKREALDLAREIADALSRMPTFAITDELLRQATSASQAGRRNALAVLSTSEERERVLRFLIEHYPELPAAVRPDALVTIAKLGGSAHQDFLAGLLFSDNAEERSAVLAAAAEARSLEFAPEVLRFVQAGVDVPAHARALAEYYRAVPAALDGEATEALARALGEQRFGEQEALVLLELLAEHKEGWTSATKRHLKGLQGRGSRKFEEAVLVALARPPSSDSKAKRQLLDPYDEAIERNEGWWQAWRDRAQIHYRIANYRQAIRDFEQALALSRTSLRGQPELFLGLARCHAKEKHWREAAEWIEKAPLSPQERRALADDPDLAELRDHPRYGKVFGLEDTQR